MGYYSTNNPKKLPSIETLFRIANREYKAKNIGHFAETRRKVQEKLAAVRAENTSRFCEKRMAQHNNVIAKCETVLAAMDVVLGKSEGGDGE
jgi:hypothetical protein